MRRFLSLSFLFAVVAFLVAGCSLKEQPMMFKRRPKFYRAVVSLSPSTSEIIASTISYSHLAGRTAADNYPAGSFARIPIVASVKPDYEKLAKLKPDLLIYDGSLYNAQDVAKLKSLGADMYAFDPQTVEDYVKQVFEMAALIGGEAMTSTNLDRVLVEESAAKSHQNSNPPKVAVIMPSETNDHWIAGTDSFLANVTKVSGGTPVGPSGKVFVKLTPELLISQNPDVIIASVVSKTDTKAFEALLKDPRLQSVNAIKNKRVTPILGDILLRRGCRVDQLIKGFYRSIGAAGDAK